MNAGSPHIKKTNREWTRMDANFTKPDGVFNLERELESRMNADGQDDQEDARIRLPQQMSRGIAGNSL